MKKRILSLVLCMAMLLVTVTGCSSEKNNKEPGSSAKPKQSASTTPLQSTDVSKTTDTPKGDWVIGLSNSYYGNTWRKQMVDSFTKVAEEAKEKGYIKDFIIQNGDNTVNAQIAQINSFILEGVDIICINAASPTALNSVIDKAVNAGIQVVAFDSTVTNEKAYTMDYDFVKFGVDCGTYVAKALGGKGNVVMVRGVSGTTPDEQMAQGYEQVIKSNPDMNIVATVQGEASSTVAQEEFSKILPSLDKVDAVYNQGGDTFGIIQAFEQAGKEIPMIIGDNSAEFLNWWSKNKTYNTISMRAAPQCGSAAFWTSLYILNGVNVPKKMTLALSTIMVDDVDQFANLEAGTIAGKDWTPEMVMNDIILASQKEN